MIRRTALLIAFYALMADTPPATFVDIAGAAGLKDVIVSGGMPKRYVLEVNGSGACWLDYDNDGLLDLYLVNGSTIAALQGKTRPPGSNHLYRNNGNRTFTEVTAKAGVPGRGWGFGCVAADYDNDGFADLFVSNFGENVLYRNRGDGTFADVTRQAGVGGGEIWHAGAAFGDYDRDGDLDLFVPGYLAFDIKHPELKTCEYQGVKVNACGPVGYIGAPDLLFRNNGDGSFTDVTSAARVTDAKLYFGFQAVFEDFDNDGWPDLFVGNDSNPNYFYRNSKDGTFEEMGVRSGVALNVDGKEMSSMGVAVGDYDHDGLMDLFVTTFAADNYVLFHNDGKGFFSDVSFESGVGEPTVPYLGWATGFLDYDNDGHLDLFCANGHVYPEVTGVLQETFLQPLQLLRNIGNGKFRDVSGAAGLASLPAMSARGGAIADFDNDGDLDIVVSILDGRPVLLENKSENTNWLRLRLTGAKSNRMGVGARVKVVAGGVTQYSSLRAGESYLSSNDPRLHFGLGTATEADVEITWPDSRVQSLGRVRGNREIAIQEPR